MSIKAYKYKLYPNKAATEKLQWVLDRCRELYNAALQERRDAYEMGVKRHHGYYDPETRKHLTIEHNVNYYSQSAQIVEIKEARPEYKEIPIVVIRDPLQRVHKAFQAFFKRAATGHVPGYPRFMGKGRYDSFTYVQRGGFRIDGNHLTLSNIGAMRMRGSKKRPIQGTIKTLTIKREGDSWYASFICEVEEEIHYHPSEEETGVDLGLLHFATLADGSTIENPRHYRRAEKKLNKLQEALSRKKRGSNRHKRAIKAVARAHRMVANQRKDFLHKESRKLVNKYRLIVFEDLQAANLSKRPKPKRDETTGQYLPNGASAKSGLNKSIRDAGWSQFVMYCTYKAEYAGGSVVTVNPKYTSQVCSGCGSVVKKALDERRHVCSCGVDLDRDHNAAINILRLGQRHRAAQVA